MEKLNNSISAEKERSFILAEMAVNVIGKTLCPGQNMPGRSANDIAEAIKTVYKALDSVVMK